MQVNLVLAILATGFGIAFIITLAILRHRSKKMEELHLFFFLVMKAVAENNDLTSLGRGLLDMLKKFSKMSVFFKVLFVDDDDKVKKESK